MTGPSEDDLIERFFLPLAGPAALGLKDDAALLAVPPGRELVITNDALVAGVHFFAEDPPGSIAAKALRVNISDLAAKGSRPVGFLLALVLPRAWTTDWLGSFAAGLAADAQAFGCPLIGGDTVVSPGPLTLSITAFGTVPTGRMVPRTGARPGDAIYVSGTIGDAALGLRLRQAEAAKHAPIWAAGLADGERRHLLDRYLHPQPRLGLSVALAMAHAGMDVSDGLVGDLAKMLRVANVTGRIDLSRVPLSAAARSAVRADAAIVDAIVTGGDDYEILATVPPQATDAFEAAASKANIPVTRIGVVLAGASPLAVLDGQGQPVAFQRPSYSHA